MRSIFPSVTVGLAMTAFLTGCEPPPTPAAAPQPPPPPPPAAPAAVPVAQPKTVELPPELISKVQQLTALYKEIQARPDLAGDLTDLDNLEKRLVTNQQVTDKAQALLVDITTMQAALTPEQQAEFQRQFAQQLKPPIPAATPGVSP